MKLESIEKLRIKLNKSKKETEIHRGKFDIFNVDVLIELIDVLLSELNAIQSEHDRALAEKLPSYNHAECMVDVINSESDIIFADIIIPKWQSSGLVEKSEVRE